MISLRELELMLSASVRMTIPRIEVGLDKVGHLAESLAAEYPGEYQRGWAPLAQATLDDKEDKDLPTPSPLKREGEMAESYRKELDLPELEMVIGSPELKALWQELGTSNGGRSIPPRPVCALALENSLPYAADVFGEIAVSLLMGKT
jgi:hypothetical protein